MKKYISFLLSFSLCETITAMDLEKKLDCLITINQQIDTSSTSEINIISVLKINTVNDVLDFSKFVLFDVQAELDEKDFFNEEKITQCIEMDKRIQEAKGKHAEQVRKIILQKLLNILKQELPNDSIKNEILDVLKAIHAQDGSNILSKLDGNPSELISILESLDLPPDELNSSTESTDSNISRQEFDKIDIIQ